MTKKSIIIGAALLVAIPAAWGAYELRHSYVCAGLEEDHLNAASSMKSTLQTQALLTRFGEKAEDFDIVRKGDEERLARTLSELYDQCGKRAAETAIRKSRETLL